MRDKPFDQLSLIVDLETIAIPDAGDYLEPAMAPSNYKSPDAIANYVQTKTAERLANAALDPDLNRICAIGWRLESRDVEPEVILCYDEDAERHALAEFWGLVACDSNRTRRLVTFNGFSFDLPTLMRRSVYLEVWPSRYLSIDKYRSPHCDLYQKLSFNGAIKPHSLRFYAQRFGLPIESPELTGADIAARVEAGDWTAVRDHCASDVNLTYALAERLRYIDFDEDNEVDADDVA